MIRNASPPIKHARCESGKQRGAVLVFFAVFLFALLPLMMLVAHLGMATLARRQMQTGVNTAAIEGLRFRDDNALSETERREQVRDLVSAVYDDNLNSDANDALRLGAGSVVTFDNDTTDISLTGTNFKGSRTIKPENIGVYQPTLQLNTSNDLRGDMVRGDYDSAEAHLENNDYTRDDFDPSAGDNAFLVRMRRSAETFSGDIGSSGPTIPFLFGRGPYGGTDLLNRRERGTIVRATAIAHAQPVMTVGVPSPADGIDQGVALFDLQRASWDSLTSVNVTFAVDGSFNTGVSGRLILREVLTLGDETTPLASTLGDSDLELGETRLVPITETIGGEDRIVGFGLVRLTGGSGSYTLERLPEAIVSLNGASNFLKPLAVSGTDFLNVWNEFQTVPGRALAPALVRSVD